MSGVTDADRERAESFRPPIKAYGDSAIYEYRYPSEPKSDVLDRVVDAIAATLAEEREKGIDIGLRNATSIDHYEVGHCCRLCGQTWPCDRAETVGLR